MKKNIFETLDNHYIEYNKTKIFVIIDKNDEVWFNANNVTTALEYIDSRSAIRNHVDKDDVIQLRNIAHDVVVVAHPQTIFMNEPGLYSLILSSKMKLAIDFKKWVTSVVLPSIRKYGSYKLKQDYDNQINDLIKQIKKFEQYKKDLKKNKYPKGALVYVIDYSEVDEPIFRIGVTKDMNLRKKIYDTHTLHKHEVVFTFETPLACKLETCVRAMLYDYRYKDKKDFYFCSLTKIKSAINNCIKSFDGVSSCNGGSKTNNKKRLVKNKKQIGGELYIDRKLITLNKKKNVLKRKVTNVNASLRN